MVIKSITNIDTTIIVESDALTAVQSDAQYQWIDCETNTEILGATNQSFTPAKMGSYAVIITINGCIDTSKCSTIDIVNSLSNALETNVTVFPNPTTGTFNIDLGTAYNDVSITVKNTLGQVILSSFSPILQKKQFDISNIQKTGLYFIEISIQGKKPIVYKIQKNDSV